MDGLIRHAPRRSDAWVIGRRETVRIEGTRISVLATRGRSRLEVALRLAVGLVVTGLFGALVLGPRLMHVYGVRSPEVRTKLKLEQLAYEALPAWAVAHPTERCPSSVGALAPFLSARNLDDGWGHRIELTCGTEVRSGRWDVRVRSAGEDGELATDDDLVLPD